MAVTTFDKIYQEAVRKGKVAGSMQDASKWFRWAASRTQENAENLMNVTKKNYGWTLSRDYLQESSIGKMYLFKYQAKTAQKLPYWDMYPLIFPLERYNDGFLGMNMHYLPPKIRGALMDKLVETSTNNKYDARTKLMIDYKMLNEASRFEYFKPCVKRYLSSYVRSNFMQVPAKAWDIVLFLPLARFQKASQATVWRDSRRIIRG